MGRVNETIDGVFVNIVGTKTKVGDYHTFVNAGAKTGCSKELTKYTKEYSKMVDKHLETFKKFADLEQIIMQMRVRENVKNIKLTLLRDYIYARVTFYRTHTFTKDIRIIAGTTDIYGEDLKKLYKNKTFMAIAKSKLEAAMDVEIANSKKIIEIS
jgi:hypothetical protein